MHDNNPYEHWKGMPEFDQEAQKPYATINFRFRCAEDLEEFSRITGIKLTQRTKSAWFPELEDSGVGSKRWV